MVSAQLKKVQRVQRQGHELTRRSHFSGFIDEYLTSNPDCPFDSFKGSVPVLFALQFINSVWWLPFPGLRVQSCYSTPVLTVIGLQAEIQSQQEAFRSRDEAMQEAQSQLNRLQQRCREQDGAAEAALAERSGLEATLTETERRLRVAEDKLAQVAPIMRRIASRAGS